MKDDSSKSTSEKDIGAATNPVETKPTSKNTDDWLTIPEKYFDSASLSLVEDSGLFSPTAPRTAFDTCCRNMELEEDYFGYSSPQVCSCHPQSEEEEQLLSDENTQSRGCAYERSAYARFAAEQAVGWIGNRAEEFRRVVAFVVSELMAIDDLECEGGFDVARTKYSQILDEAGIKHAVGWITIAGCVLTSSKAKTIDMPSPMFIQWFQFLASACEIEKGEPVLRKHFGRYMMIKPLVPKSPGFEPLDVKCAPGHVYGLREDCIAHNPSKLFSLTMRGPSWAVIEISPMPLLRATEIEHQLGKCGLLQHLFLHGLKLGQEGLEEEAPAAVSRDVLPNTQV